MTPSIEYDAPELNLQIPQSGGIFVRDNRIAIVKFQKIGPESSCFVGYGYIKNIVGYGWSLESNAEQAEAFVPLYQYNQISIQSFPFDPDNDYSLAITLSDWIYRSSNVTVTGNIDASPVTALKRLGADSWESAVFWCYIVTGDGTFTLTPKE